MEEIPFRELPEYRKLEILDSYVNSNDTWYECIFEIIECELEEYGFNEIEISFSGFYSQGDGASFTSKYINMKRFIEKEKTNLYFKLDDGSVIGEKEENLGLDPMLIMALEDLNEDLDEDNYLCEIIKNKHISGYIQRNSQRYLHESTVTSEVYCEYMISENNDISEYSIDITEDIEYELNKFNSYLDEYLCEWVKDKCREMYRRLEQEWDAYNKNEMEYLEEENDLYSI